MTAMIDRQRRGARAQHWGLAAEDCAARRYAELGGVVLARRARTAGGELDLVIRLGRALVFVEVKARAALERALEAFGPRQQTRVAQAAACWMAEQGLFDQRDARIDLAAVDRSGRVHILENALAG